MDREQQHQEDLQRIRGFRLIDDDFMNACFDDNIEGTELGKLMHDFFCTDPSDMHFKKLADKVRYFKEDERGVAAMCKVMEDMRLSVAEETEEQTKIQSAMNLLKLGKLSLEEIANAMELSIEKVEELAMPKTV